jgi:ribosomal protein S18 acetylase RimI-like enzyme
MPLPDCAALHPGYEINMTDAHIEEITSGKASICKDILAELPEWFGIPEATAAYVRDVEALQMFACMIEDRAVGFIALKVHSPFVAEAYVLGVRRQCHRMGVGRALFAYAEGKLRERRFVYLTVKTVAPVEPPNKAYAATRRFYEAIGFLPVEVFPTLWGAHNPCLLMIKSLAGAGG